MEGEEEAVEAEEGAESDEGDQGKGERAAPAQQAVEAGGEPASVEGEAAEGDYQQEGGADFRYAIYPAHQAFHVFHVVDFALVIEVSDADAIDCDLDGEELFVVVEVVAYLSSGGD